MIYESDEIKELVKKGELPQITEENYHSKEIPKDIAAQADEVFK